MELYSYNSTAVFAGGSDPLATPFARTIHQLYGIQSINFDIGEPLADVESAQGIFERVHLAPNQVNMSMSYLLRDGNNERNIGFNVEGTGAAFANFWGDERNYFVAMRNTKGQNQINYSGYDNTVISFAQGCLTSYGVQCSVGQPMMANVSLAFLNVGMALTSYEVQLPVVNKQNGQTIYSYGLDNYFFTGSGDENLAQLIADDYARVFSGSGDSTNWSGELFSLLFSGDGSNTDWSSQDSLFILPFATNDPTPIYAIGQGDIRLSFPSDASFSVVVSGENDILVQSFDIQAALPRQEDRPMNYIYPRSRLLDPPIETRLTVNAYVRKYQAALLNERLCDNTGHAVELQVTQRCNGNKVIRYHLDGLRLDSSTFGEAIGQYQTVTFNWSSKIFNINRTGVNIPNITIGTGLL